MKRGDPGECWPWTGATFHFGHGAFKRGGRPWGAHRIAWELTFGRPVPTELHVLHRCDNPPCCNPAHLYLGTLADNGRDMAVRGRVGTQKLTVSQVQVARIRCQSGEKITDLALEMGVSLTAMASAIRGKTFSYLPGEVPSLYRRRRRRTKRLAVA